MPSRKNISQKGLQYYVQGESDPQVVFIHGLFGCGRNWHSYLRYVNEQFSLSCCAPDLRGQGDSAHFSSPGSIESLVEDIYDFLSELNLSKKPVIIGHSLGAKIAIVLAAKYPQVAEKIMVVDTALHPINRDVFIILDWLNGLPKNIQERREARSYFDDLTQDQRLRNFLLTNLVKGEDGYGWRLDLQGLHGVVTSLTTMDLEPYWLKINVPICLVRGKNSEHLTAEEAQRMTTLRDVDFVEIDDAEHWVHADNPEAFKKCLDNFLV